MPCYSTISNHTEDVMSMFSLGLKQRHPSNVSEHPFLSLPLRVETEMHGLIVAATKKEFCAFMTKQLESSAKQPLESVHDESDISSTTPTNAGVLTTYRCLVCIRDPDDIDRIESMVNHTIEHYVDVRSPTPKKFVLRNKPNASSHEWQRCLMKITNVGSPSSAFRAACVKSKYSDSNDYTLAHRLWGPNMEHPAEDLGVQYVMQIDVQLLTKCPHQVRGQLAALGFPIVGDAPYGGGTCEMRIHRHMWRRMAIQICHLEFSLPKWDEASESCGEKKRVLVKADEKKCVFHLNTAWWSEYLLDYERYSPVTTIETVMN